MIEAIRIWLENEARSLEPTKPPYKSYADLINKLNKSLKASALPPEVQDVVRSEALKAIASVIELRIRKIMHIIVTGGKPRDLLEEEERLVAILEKLREETDVKKGRIVVFVKDYPAFTTSDFKQVGPFNKGDIAKLPPRDAEYLISKGVAKPFEI